MNTQSHETCLPPNTFRLFDADLNSESSEEALETLVRDIMHSNRAGSGMIPAGFTYLGQFIAHDISHVSDPPEGHQISTPALDLDSVYGQGFGDPRGFVNLETGEMNIVIITDRNGCPIGFDLPRTHSVANIPDERNDENLIVSQMHALWLQIHNMMLPDKGSAIERFESARASTIALYQQVIIDDYLKQICNDEVYDCVVADGPQWLVVSPKMLEQNGLPIELVAAAFRFGHAMVLPAYNLNQRATTINKSLQDIFTMTTRGKLNGASQLPADWTVDWNMFFEIDRVGDLKVNKAQEISPKIDRALKNFDEKDEPLPLRTLKRANQWLLPCAQSVVAEIKAKIEKAHPKIAENLVNLSCKTAYKKSQYINSDMCDVEHNLIWQKLGGNIPLWYFILSEDWLERTDPPTRRGHLGSVGSWLVAETMLGLIDIAVTSVFDSSARQPSQAARAKIGLNETETITMQKIIVATLSWSKI